MKKLPTTVLYMHRGVPVPTHFTCWLDGRWYCSPQEYVSSCEYCRRSKTVTTEKFKRGSRSSDSYIVSFCKIYINIYQQATSDNHSPLGLHHVLHSQNPLHCSNSRDTILLTHLIPPCCHLSEPPLANSTQYSPANPAIDFDASNPSHRDSNSESIRFRYRVPIREHLP